jgi:hypothetical protein
MRRRIRRSAAIRLRSATGMRLAPTTEGKFCMKWTKPEFELMDLCSEVTSYFHHR